MLVFPSPFPCSHGTMTILHTQSILSPWICPCVVHAGSSLWLCCCVQQCCPHCCACLQLCIAHCCLRLQSNMAMLCLYPKLLAPLALQQSSCLCPAPAYSLHLWQSGSLTHVCVCVGDFETLFRCINLQQPLCTMQCRLQLHCFIWRRNTRLQMCHQVCTMLLSAISVAGKPVHL